MPYAKGAAVYATSRINNDAMHGSLIRRGGFQVEGSDYPSTENDVPIRLFVRPLTDMYETLSGLARSPTTAQEKFVSVSLNVSPPSDVSYQIGAFLNDEKLEEKETFSRRMQELGGVEANFECRLHGRISYPDALVDQEFELLVNPLAGSSISTMQRRTALVTDGIKVNSYSVCT